MANIRDVAKRANVGIATVSRYINDEGYVSEELGEKIKSAIDELNYTPNALARALFTKRSQLIGLIIPDIENPFFPQLYRSIEAGLQYEGYNIMIFNSDYSKEKELEILEKLISLQADGIIVASTNNPEVYRDCKTPIISFDTKLSDDKIMISCDNQDGGRKVAQMVIRQKLKSVLFLSGPDYLSSAIGRKKGFLNTLEDIDVSIEIIQIVKSEELDNIHLDLSKYDLIFSWNDDIATAALKICYEQNIDIPNKIQIVGFDNTYFSSRSVPGITTVDQNLQIQGAIASEIIIKKINDTNTPDKDVIIPVKIIERESTKH